MRRQTQENHNLGQLGRRPCSSLGIIAVNSRLPQPRRLLSPIGYFGLCVVYVVCGRVKNEGLSRSQLAFAMVSAFRCRVGASR